MTPTCKINTGILINFVDTALVELTRVADTLIIIYDGNKILKNLILGLLF